MSNEEIEPHKNASCVLTRKTDGIVSEKQIKNYLDNSRDRTVKIVPLFAIMSSPARMFIFAELCALKRDLLCCGNPIFRFDMGISIRATIRKSNIFF